MPDTPEKPAAHDEAEDPTARMSFFDHLGELRTRILWSLVAIAIGFVAGFAFAEEAYNFLAQPVYGALREAGLPEKLTYISPLGPVRLLLSVSLYLGVILALPVVLHQVWLFVAPGLYRKERRAVQSFLFSGVALFLAGTAFGYFVILPVMLKFLIGFAGFDPRISPMITMNEYLDFVLVVLLGLGLIFQLPILIFVLSAFGLVTPKFLWDNFQYAVLIIAVIAAVITPTTDVFTMGIFMAPMIVLYVVGIGVSALVVRQKRREAGEPVTSPTAMVVWAVLLVGGAALAWAATHYGWWKFR
jgi:sec-independent protein translocase protein TatC